MKKQNLKKMAKAITLGLVLGTALTAAQPVWAEKTEIMSAASGTGIGIYFDGRKVSWGLGTTASKDNATAWGSNTTADGIMATAFGYKTTASGDYSTAFGENTTASGKWSTAFGQNTQAGILRTWDGVEVEKYGIHVLLAKILWQWVVSLQPAAIILLQWVVVL